MLPIDPDSDDFPDAPVGTPQTRKSVAIHWHWTTELTCDEIGKRLGVTGKTVKEYLSSPPAEEVKEQMDGVEAEVRMIAVQELKDQLRRAGHESKTAERPVKIYQDDNGDLIIHDKENDDGEVVDRYPVPAGLEMGPDSKARFFRREEVREIIDLLTDLVGAKAAEQHEVTGEGGGPVEVVIKDSVVDADGNVIGGEEG